MSLSSYFMNQLKDAGFELTGQKKGVKLEMRKGRTNIYYCHPCQHIEVNGKILKFSSHEYKKFVDEQRTTVKIP